MSAILVEGEYADRDLRDDLRKLQGEGTVADGQNPNT
jgi:hypothetical protein